MMCWHKWSKWKVIGEGALRAEYDAFTGRKFAEGEKFPSGRFERQRRECEKCGKSRLRKTSDI